MLRKYCGCPSLSDIVLEKYWHCPVSAARPAVPPASPPLPLRSEKETKARSPALCCSIFGPWFGPKSLISLWGAGFLAWIKGIWGDKWHVRTRLCLYFQGHLAFAKGARDTHYTRNSGFGQFDCVEQAGKMEILRCHQGRESRGTGLETLP